jgi:hypothetical protein
VTIEVAPNGADIIERVIAAGDLAKLSPQERTHYYGEVCRSLGLNPLTKPFDYLNLSGKLVLYATRGATDQLRKIHHVSTSIVSRETVGDVYVVTAKATDRSGRSDESIGAVSIGSLKGDALCNALMKAETKAKRRATLAIVGLSFLDETEVETIPGARYGDGALDAPPPRGRAIAAQMDQALAEADALLAEPIEATPFEQEQAPEETGELPGPRWGTTPLGVKVSEIWDRLTVQNDERKARGQNVIHHMRPLDNATDDEVRRWIAAMERAIKATQSPR